MTDNSSAKRHILLVEDNATNQKIASIMLSKIGCEITIAANGQEAVDFFTEHQYDLVFMDCQMPVMDGFAATDAMRELEKTRDGHTPIIALTANAMQGDVEKCRAAGMDDYMSKPVKIQDFRQILSKWLDN